MFAEVVIDDTIDYGHLIDEAMRGIVRKSVEMVIQEGLPGDHHFYISFLTHYPGVMISDELRVKYPEEMTIVLQHQFWNLEVEDDRFTVVLSFNNIKHNLTIPFAAITSFADPSVKFGLQFRQPGLFQDDLPLSGNYGDGTQENTAVAAPVTDGSNIVSLDTFRKNNK